MDWMDYRNALNHVDEFKVPVQIGLVHGGTHHLYLDRHEAFNDALVCALEDKLSKRDDVSYPHL